MSTATDTCRNNCPDCKAAAKARKASITAAQKYLARRAAERAS